MKEKAEVLPGYKLDKKGLYRTDEYGVWRPIEVENGRLIVQRLRTPIKTAIEQTKRK